MNIFVDTCKKLKKASGIYGDRNEIRKKESVSYIEVTKIRFGNSATIVSISVSFHLDKLHWLLFSLQLLAIKLVLAL